MAERSADTATVLFTDVVGSTDLANRVGDEECRRLLETHEGVIREEIARHGGREVKTMGDGFMVAFPDPRPAVDAALAIQRRLPEEAPGVSVRMGLHAGEVMERGGDLFGASVNAAARISAHARGGQILLSEELVPHAGGLDGASLVDRGLFWLKGFPERWRLHELSWTGQEITAPDHPRTPFIGREEERADLRRHLEEALAGRGSLVLIGGEPGVGKTRLAEELSWEADQRGARVLAGYCSQMEGGLPYMPWVGILEQAVGRARSAEALRELLGGSAGEIARIVPQIRRLFDDIPPPMDLPPEQERRYLFNSIRDFIGRAAELRPMLLVLDDLHWADEPTLLLLEHVAESLHDVPLLVLGTYRDVELEVERPLARTLEELLRRRLAQRISLKRLDRPAVAAMMAGLVGQDPPPDVVGVVFAETEGNAFFVEEVVRHLMEEGRLIDEAGRWRSDVVVNEVDVPESLRLVIGRRLQRLTEPSRKVLAAAAAIGRHFETGLLEAVAAGDEDEVLDALESAETARLIAATDGGERFEFAHELIRQTLLAGISTLRLQRLHRKLAEAIEASLGDRADERAEEIVHHLLNAGSGTDADKLLRYLTVAGRRAMDAAAWEDALGHFENALSLVEGRTRARAEALVNLGLALRSLGRIEDAATAWREALDLYTEVDEAEAAAELCAQLAYDLGYSGRAVQGLEFVQRGLAISAGMRSAARVRLVASGSSYLAWAGQREEAAAQAEEALALAVELGDPWLEAYVYASRATAAYLFMDFRGVVEAGRHIEASKGLHGRPWERAVLLGLVEFAHLFLGEPDASEAVGEEQAPIAERMGSGLAIILHGRAAAFRDLWRTGDFRAQEAFALRDLELCERLEQLWVAQSHSFLAISAELMGRWDEALDHHRRAVSLELPGAFEGWSAGGLLLHLAQGGREEEALALLGSWEPRFPAPDQPITFGAWTMALYALEVLALLDRRREAARLAPFAERALDEGVLLRGMDGRPVPALAGLAAAAGGRWDEAEERFAEALAQARGLPQRLHVPEVQRLHATVLLRWGDAASRGRATAMLEEAAAGYRDLGMSRHAELAERLVEAPHPSP